MLYIIDNKTGNCFDAKGSYINYIDGAQSTNVGYIKQIFLVSNKENLKISVPESQDIFNIIDIESHSNTKLTNDTAEYINEVKYYDIQKHICKSLISKGISANCSLPDSYIHCIYIYAQSAIVGTLIEDVTVSDRQGKDSYIIKVAGDFYDENEVEKINLENFGQEIPQQFVKAIYQTNLHDDAIDNIVLNRKRKELLCEYKNLEYQKGNYNSLLNYLTWFEYGDKLRLSEYWKVTNEPIDHTLQERDLTQIISQHLKDVLDTEAKSTLIGIHCALEKLKTFESGNVKYESEDSDKFAEIEGSNGFFSARSNANFDPDITERESLRNKETEQHYDLFFNEAPETQNIDRSSGTIEQGSNWLQKKQDGDSYFVPELLPELESVTFKWSYEDMSLKMRLLAEFYATYFMPLHLDLVQCSIESIALYTIKKINWWRQNEVTSYDNTNIPFKINTDKTLWLDCNTKSKVLEFQNLNQPDTSKLIAPFETEYYRGIGVTSIVTTNISDLINDYNINTKKLTVALWLNDELEYESSRYFTGEEDAKKDIIVSYYRPGKHVLQVIIEDFSGAQLIGTQEVIVNDTTSHDISIKRIVKMTDLELEAVKDKPNDFVDNLFNTYNQILTEEQTNNCIYTDLRSWNASSPGLTEVIKSYVEQKDLTADDWYIYKTNGDAEKYYYFSKKYVDKYKEIRKDNEVLEHKICFIPMLNTYEEIKEQSPVFEEGTVIALSSQYNCTTKYFEDAYILTNKTDKTTYQKSTHEPIFGNLTPGIYSLTYKYSFGDTIIEKTKDRIFIISRT